jgi:putative ABC transport system ATP-binding protein
MVFQNYALYPHMSVYDNMAYGLRVRGMPKPEIEIRVQKAAKILELAPLLQRKPRQLSGGQRQRVAVARALVGQPSILLADEPTGNLDSRTSGEIMALFDALHAQGQTVVVVTHEPDIAAHCHRFIRVLDGRIVEDRPNRRAA